MTRKDETNNILKILDYWYMIEFLSQETAQAGTKSSQKTKSSEVKDSVLLEEKDISDPLENIITKEANSYKRPVWGNLTFYIGKVSRERCIKYINNLLPYGADENVSPEKNTEDIFCVSLQLSQKGMYVKGSLSLSPILWAISQLKNSGNNFSDMIDEELYQEDENRIEEMFFGPEQTIDKDELSEDDEHSNNVVSSDNAELKFSEYAITSKDLRNLLSYIDEHYIKDYLELGGEESCLKRQYRIDFQLFQDETTRENNEDSDYYGLSGGYYLEDLKHLIKKTKNGSVDSSYMGKDLEKYILALCQQPDRKRMDLIRGPKPDDRNKYFCKIIDILDVKNAPLGKWPSQYMPALMQQIAINLAIGKTSEDYGNIFSINGPPGTGKTTLVKEIVASNVVDRAVLLSDYDRPDDAFQLHKLEKLQEEKFLNYWHSLKDDRINNYSILVASNNNAAVENISKELPKIDSSYASSSDVGALFDPQKTGMMETYHQFGKDPSDEEDIYFTKYAKNLLSNEGHEDTEDTDDSHDSMIWGLVSAALGKPTNLRKFYKYVLQPFGFDFGSNDAIAKRLKNYQVARKAFKDQLIIVKQLQEQLHNMTTLLKEKLQSKEKLEQARSRKICQEKVHKQAITNAQQEIKKLEISQNNYQDKMRQCQEKEDCSQSKINSLNHSVDLDKKNEDMLCADITEQKRSIHWWIRLFNRTRYYDAKNKVEDIKQKIQIIESNIENLNLEIVAEEDAKRTIIDNINFNKEKAEEITESIKEQNSLIRDHKYQQAKEAQDCEDAEKEYVEANNKYDREVRRIYPNKEDQCKAIDEDFLDKLFFEGEETSNEVQISNPWCTKQYDQEREKLFALAMRLNKEFVLSSTCCRQNFYMLSYYWGYRKTNKNEKVSFLEQDRENMLPALIQTLFLLVPVISTTFASVGIMLKEAKDSGTIGMLVVDEAGQAQPQIALGALYRCRKAIVMGDPKQIEPVVTDDLKLLKDMVNDEQLVPYKSNEISVQNFADQLNCYGTYLVDDTNHMEWVGCPLLIHRRCISPMYDISNEISYNGIMIYKTSPPSGPQKRKFIYPESRWINVIDKEIGRGNHFVIKQGDKVCELLDIAFKKQEKPKIFIISPFKTVVSEMKKYIKRDGHLSEDNINYMLKGDPRIGTVHTFQGKETDEVIFLLGCDKDSLGAVRWVNTNIVNVAVTRAKYRIYFVGDANVWKHSDCVNMAKTIMDKYNSEHRFEDI